MRRTPGPRTALIAVSALVISLTLGACGGGSSPSTTAKKSTTTVKAVPTTNKAPLS